MNVGEIIIWIFIFMLLSGVSIEGFFSGIRARRKERLREEKEERRREVEGPPPICGCGHHVAYHNPQSGTCGETVKIPVKWDVNLHGEEYVSSYEARSCHCARYVGPEPMTIFYSPEMTDVVFEDPRED